AFQRMLELGSDVDTIAAETGLSIPTVRKRLALVERLAPAALEALEAGRINLGQAQALTSGSIEAQERILSWRQADVAFDVTPQHIRSSLTRDAIPVSRAKFPRDWYKGTIVSPGIFDPDGEDVFA